MINNLKRSEYLPTPAEIERKCKEIQRRWSANERWRRMGGVVDDSVRKADQEFHTPVLMPLGGGVGMP